MLDAARSFAPNNGFHIFDAAGDGAGLFFQGGFAPAVEAGLVGFYFEKTKMRWLPSAKMGFRAVIFMIACP